MERSDVRFGSEGDECAAWLYRPEAESPTPIVVMGHGFSATRELRLDAYAERFVAAGLGALVFDYRHFGASGGEPRQLLDVKRQHADWRAAIRYAKSLDWVDPGRVALFGSSFSGGHVIAVAAADPTVAAIVSQCPMTDDMAATKAMETKNVAKLTLAAVRDRLRQLSGRPPYYVKVVGPPGSFAVMTAPDAVAGMEALVPEPTRWENRVAARMALGRPYRPGKLARGVKCPALFQVCDKDSVAPADTTVKLISDAPRGEIKRYPVGHFDIYVGAPWERAVADQTEFLVRHLASPRNVHSQEPAAARE